MILNAGELPAGVDVSLDDVTAESCRWSDGALEIDWRSGS